MTPTITPEITSIIRHFLTGIGGVGIALGAVDQAGVDNIIENVLTAAGAASFLFGAGWSIVKAVKDRKAAE